MTTIMATFPRFSFLDRQFVFFRLLSFIQINLTLTREYSHQ
jgi:hypothetical protein